MRLASKVAVVTGGGSGMGAAICRRFAAESAKVVIFGCRADRAEAVANELGGSATAFLSSIPLGRLCTPDDVAHAMVYLASGEASFVTGVVMEVDGGRCI